MAKLFRGEVNFIKYILTHPCADPWFILAETFLPAVLTLAITILTYDLADILRSQARQIERQANVARRAGRCYSKRSRIPMREPPAERFANKLLTKVLWITQPLENLGLWILIFSAVDRFFYNWHSLLQQHNYCQKQPSTGPLQRTGGAGSLSWPSGGNNFSLPVLVQNRAGWPNTAFGVTLPAGRYQVIVAVKAKSNAPILPNCRLRIIAAGALLHPFPIEGEAVDLNNQQFEDVMVVLTLNLTLDVLTTVTWETISPSATGLGSVLTGRAIIYEID